MNNNPTTLATYKTNGPSSMMIPRYINPVLEQSHQNSGMEMTSSSQMTNQNVDGSATTKALGMVKLPYMAVTQEPSNPIHHVGVNNYNNGQAREVCGRDEERYWSSGLFSCFDDWSSCLLGMLCPCCLAMTISCSLNECCCTATCYPVATRTKIRTQYNIVGTICEDAYILCWCCQCALCQMAREIDANTE